MIIETIVALYHRIVRDYNGPCRLEQGTELGEPVFVVHVPTGTEHEFVPEVFCGGGLTRVVVRKDLEPIAA